MNSNILQDNINQLSLLAAVIIFFLTVFVAGKYIKQMKTDKSTGELADENWDGIGEYKNELPAGWAYTFLGTMVWALWYWTAGYPVNAYSQIGEYNEEVAAHQKTFESKWASADKQTLQEMGEGVYLVQCAPCHGIAGDGMGGKAADLTVWGSAAGVLETIKNGSKGLGYPMGEMPGGMLSGDAAKKVAEYVANGMKGEQPAEFATCAGCHGADGKGMGGMAPDLTKYGTPAFVADVLERGKKGYIGKMVSFKGRLTPVQEKAVGSYILSLARGE
ncbi:cbb3-type cytochrome c oxidase N-terminal domain-containing protein [Hydrogenimonas thermophila]|uniref:Cytochrome c oxidase subunit III n=1 Tax=Hydrogenimonas thermophila TaxID=223786 RepID=A0A1I5L7H7_9BACT|nr:cbb3-type cytochrome c oxidase N-terminal domain-containing protein [Hydrogenimonas thermophila]SFO93175.1 cytochrome c oxidase cbb3-type subunit 3 [Hydrogenimonas thermophila]